jgi:hypothetical protein
VEDDREAQKVQLLLREAWEGLGQQEGQPVELLEVLLAVEGVVRKLGHPGLEGLGHMALADAKGAFFDHRSIPEQAQAYQRA